ncbi:MAG: hypothetical protein K6G31_14190 [Paludibacteraceae bacterium]|nr:hypothetical protein [Paludibacteraceae bacterium]MBR6041470.1 hypothetical protein [Paludibacteraceae bacterium]MCR5570399.1 hypothetical protein [Paludibacteraceae bacterium]
MKISATQKAEDNERVAQLAEAETPFTEDDLRAKWKVYTERMSEKKIVQVTMQSCILKFNDNYQVDIVVENEVQQHEMEEEKVDLLTFLSKELNNGKIRLNIRLSEIGENKFALTNKDRFLEMMKRNPELEVLTNSLGLELE